MRYTINAGQHGPHDNLRTLRPLQTQAQRLLLGSALQRADHAADALSSDGADAGVAPTSTNGRSSPRVVVALATVRPIVELTPRRSLRLAETRVVTKGIASRATTAVVAIARDPRVLDR